LKLYYYEPPLNFAFKFILRRYIKAAEESKKRMVDAAEQERDEAGGLLGTSTQPKLKPSSYAFFQGTSNGGQRVSNLRRRSDLPYNGTILR